MYVGFFFFRIYIYFPTVYGGDMVMYARLSRALSLARSFVRCVTIYTNTNIQFFSIVVFGP